MSEGAEPVENRLIDLKRFFEKEGETLTTVDFKAEWEQLSEEEKIWFKTQSIK